MRQKLSERKRVQTFFTLRLNAELFRLLEQFRAHGIGAVAIKGPVLAVQAYGDPAMRSYGDLDLLVRSRYSPRHGIDERCRLSAGCLPQRYRRRENSRPVSFSKPDSKLLVELHNDFTLRYFPRRLPLTEFFARQVRVQVDGHEIPALSVEDELVLICIHGPNIFGSV